MKKITLLILILITLLSLKIPPYIELNDLVIIETIIIKKDHNIYNVYLKEIIPKKDNNSIIYEYKYYNSKNNNIIKAIESIQTKTDKKIYISKTKTLITNISNTDKLKKELNIKPNSIIHTKNIEKYLKN